ncbi:MAG TPA: M48 family metalloprotease [bacterium]|nr:M48 family metalloprotease [bacterium]
MRSLLACVLALAILAASASASAAAADDAEIRIGRDSARAVEAQYKILGSGPDAERVTQIGRQMAALSDRPALPWTFKIVDLPDPNAVALPGGPVYVTKGMLTFIRSEHELAAVLAHEVAHTSFRHQMELMRRGNQAAFFVILAAIITRDVAAAQGAHLVSLGLLAGYTRDMERQADLAGIGYLARSSYTPVAALTVMERLRREEILRPGVDPGDLRDHPRTEERVAYIEAELKRRGTPLTRRPAANFLRVSTKTVAENGREIAELYVNDGLILRLQDVPRLQTMAAALNRFFDLDPEPGQVRSEGLGTVIEIVGGRATLLRITRDDAALTGMSQNDLAAQIVARLQEAIRKDRQDRRFKG